MPVTYGKSGVNIAAGDDFVRELKGKVRSTFSPDVLSGIGSFGSFYKAKFTGMKEPVLVSSVDGVGTKLKVAFLMGKHDSVGRDLVNHCVNDIAVCGARPLFFLDYFATGKLQPKVAASVLEGMIAGCKENGCSLVGGETAEMPGFYRQNEYDIAGMIVGVADRKSLFDGKRVRAGDNLIGLPSTGLHTNGYSLARTVLFERYEVEDFVQELDMRLGEALLAVHRSYYRAIASIAGHADTHALAHITGGGIAGNTSRVVPDDLDLSIDWKRWERPAIFRLIQKCGNVPEHDMRRTFNLGVGLVIIAGKGGTEKILRILRGAGEKPFVFGKIVKKSRQRGAEG